MEAGTFARECSCSYSASETSSFAFQKPFFRSTRSQKQCRRYQKRSCPLLQQKQERILIHAADLSADYPRGDEEPPQLNEIFPRIREGNPYRRLGVSAEASFEEVQEARNFLYEAYRHHEASREAIELAYEKILKASFKNREKFGFQPPKSGRRNDLKGDQIAPTVLERVKDAIEPDIGIATIVNDGSIYLALSTWAAWQATATDPTFPVALTIIYTCYKFFTKRKNRNPDGPFLGGSPFFAALGMTILAFATGTMASVFITRLVPAAAARSDSAGLFVVCIAAGIFSLFFR